MALTIKPTGFLTAEHENFPTYVFTSTRENVTGQTGTGPTARTSGAACNVLAEEKLGTYLWGEHPVGGEQV